MKTILYFQSSLNASNNSVLDGVSRYARSANWKVRVTPYADAAYLLGDHADGRRAPDVKGLLEFWKPDGVIAECGARIAFTGVQDLRVRSVCRAYALERETG